MSTNRNKARQWKCDRCEVSVGRIDGERTALPDTWAASKDGRFCLVCRRERAADAALDSAPGDSTHEARARLRRAALLEFEVSRVPDHANNLIAKSCHSSVSAVAEARQRLQLPDPPPRSGRKPAQSRAS